MNRSRSSNAWLREHVNDTYVQRAKAQGYRSRASYKLVEMDDRDHLIRAGDVVVDLGATPGGWSQVAAKKMQGKGRIIAVDLLEMAPLPGVIFVQGDFREQAVLHNLENLLAGEKVGLVLSDMSPNISGIALCDQARAAHLAELALEFARNWLKPDGALLVKAFPRIRVQRFCAGNAQNIQGGFLAQARCFARSQPGGLFARQNLENLQ
jgi:23S rRNA (uridine2552-2'-O)-methyltransferase